MTGLAFASQWEIVDQRANTTTGFSGTLFRNKADPDELVLSFRSTEFIDDAIRDTLATNTYEIKNTGYAWGQISDMEAWYAELQADPAKLQGKAFTVTGYSLGGHLATAFNLLHPGAAQQVITFNGAGVGKVTQGTLADALATFNLLKADPTQIESRFSDPALAIQYETIRSHLADQTWTIDQAKTALTNAYPPGQMSTEALDVWWALDEIAELKTEAARIATLHAGGNGPDAATSPKAVPADQVKAEDLDYRMAVKFAAKNTQSAWLPNSIAQAYGTKSPLGITLQNQYDVVGDTSPSAIANSQWHAGTHVPLFIEDQPLYRGGIGAAVLGEALDYGSIKLLVDNYAIKDFGDTHSLTLLVDSLSVQSTLLQLMEQAQQATAAPLLNSILKGASYLRKVDGDLVTGTSQGKAEGDVLENVVNALGYMLLGTDYVPIQGNSDGNTWANIEDSGGYAGRATLHETLTAIQGSTAYQNLAGKVQLAAAPTNAQTARTDFGALLSLIYLTPFSLQTLDADAAEALKSVHQDLAARWEEDKALTSEELAQGKASFTNQYLADRAAFLERQTYYNNANARYDTSDGMTVAGDSEATQYDAEEFIWTDRQSGIRIQRGSTIPANTRYIVFGSEMDETDIAGGNQNDRLYGGGGKDTLDGGQGDDHLEGHTGDDSLKGGAGIDELLGGDGNDVIDGVDGAGGDMLVGGKGYDSYSADDGDTILDFDGSGQVLLNNKKLTNATRSQGETVYHDEDGNSFVWYESGLKINNQLVIKEFENGQLGIYLDEDGTPAESPDYNPDEASQIVRRDPLVLDLNGNDKIDTIGSTQSNAYFDFNGDGIAEHVGWIDGGDGLLAIDVNNNGTIDNLSELFGTASLGGFEDLRLRIDSNDDGVIDENDGDFSELRVWQDSNGDGKTQTGELKTLTGLGITSIAGNPFPVQIPDADNLITALGSFQQNGETKLAGDTP